jgi:Ca2+-binding RTX toxin-like protein
LLGATAALLLVGALAPALAGARVRCTYQDGGLPILPQGNVMSITMDQFDALDLRRAGDAIELRDDSTLGSKIHVSCSGGTPTVTNIDSIVIDASSARSTSVFINLGGGPLAPGATAEPDGTSEIEISVRQHGSQSDMGIHGSALPDSFRFGTSGGHPAANLNAGQEAPASADVDLTFTRPGFHDILSGRGNDRISADGGPGFDGQLGSMQVGFFAGKGDDVLRGHDAFDWLDGGDGADTIRGLGGRDLIAGGAGRDLLFGGGGNDVISSRRGSRDRVSCGAGADQAFSDAQDRLSGCERIFHSPVSFVRAF